MPDSYESGLYSLPGQVVLCRLCKDIYSHEAIKRTCYDLSSLGTLYVDVDYYNYNVNFIPPDDSINLTELSATFCRQITENQKKIDREKEAGTIRMLLVAHVSDSHEVPRSFTNGEVAQALVVHYMVRHGILKPDPETLEMAF